MAYQSKTWKNTIAQYPNRRTITDVSDTSSVKTVEVVRSVGTISQEGDQWNASNMNDMESRIALAFGEVFGQLGGYTFWSGTQQEYNNLGSYSTATFYFIKA